MMNSLRRRLCLIALCTSFAIIGGADGFQHQQLQSQRHPFRSVRTGTTDGGTSKPKTTTLAPPDSVQSSSTTTQLNALQSSAGSLAVLAGIVVVHESGHYLAARYFNITVEEFSVGFGPKIAGFNAFGNEFNLRALPLGGYVRFPENYDSEAALENFELKRKARTTIRRERQKEKTEWNWKDEVLNAATLGYWDERKIDETRKEKKLKRRKAAAKVAKGGFLASLFGGNSSNKKSDGGNTVDIDKVYEDLDDMENYEVEYFDDPQLLQNRPWPERAVVLSGGVIFNILLAFSIYFAAIGPLPVGGNQGLPRAVFDNGVVVKQDPRPDGPSSGKLLKGDVITEINGRPIQIEGNAKTSVSAGQKQVSDIISVIRATPDGTSVTVNVLRAEGGAPSDGLSDVSAAKRTSKTFNIQPKRSDGTTQTIGIMLGPNFDRLDRLKSNNPVVALKLAWEYLSDIFTQTLLGTVSVLASLFSPSGPPPGEKISGPIGLISQGSSVVATRDWTAVLLFAAGLSVNLGVINALPIPALDGGQLVFVFAEAITGKKVDQKLQERITSFFVSVLLLLSLSTAFGDILSL